MSKVNKNKVEGIFPVAIITDKNWWKQDFSLNNLTKAGAVATQEQCSSGGGGNGQCGTGTKARPGKQKR
jgi:hypothetical protein